MTPLKTVQKILQGQSRRSALEKSEAFAPINIALIKYWGKRDVGLNLPETDSLSLTFPEWGTTTQLSPSDVTSLEINGIPTDLDTPLGQRLQEFLALFELEVPLAIRTYSNIPIGAGVASSASGFAALVLAMEKLCGWDLDPQSRSILARLGSGSACRSFWRGLVLWKRGTRPDGLDSHGVPLSLQIPNLCTGFLLLHQKPKKISSRSGMRRTQETSPYYPMWSEIVRQDLSTFLQGLLQQDFQKMGQVVERNAWSLHRLLETATPALSYTTAETIAAIQKVFDLRQQGVLLYWTQDAGPNIKLLFQREHQGVVQRAFPGLLLSDP